MSTFCSSTDIFCVFLLKTFKIQIFYFLPIVTIVEGLFFCETQMKGRKPNPTTQIEKKSAKDREKKTLSPIGRNKESQVHKINKWALRKQMGSKEPEKREIANSKLIGSV